MAMIGRNAAIAEIGPRRRELHGVARLRVVAGRARLAAERLPRAGDGAVVVGMGLLHKERAPSIIDRSGRRPHRLGRTVIRVRSSRPGTFLTRRRIGWAVTIAAVVAAVACLVGAVVAWQLLGELRDRTATSLQLLESTLNNVDDTLAIAQDVTGTVGSSLDTIEQSLAILTQGVEDGATALDAVADLTEDVPPALDRLDRTLVRLRDAAAVVDTGLNAIGQLPIGPNISDTQLAASVDGVRGDISPIADGLRNSTSSIRSLAGSSGELVVQISALEDDLAELDESLDRSAELLDQYRADTEEAIVLAQESLDDLDRNILLSRLLIVILAVTIAIGQIAPFDIGRQLARTPDPAAPL